MALYRQAAEELEHAKSMNLLGRYLEDSRYCAQDLKAAWQWYQRSAEGGDFRGQFSHAAVPQLNVGKSTKPLNGCARRSLAGI